MASRNCIEDFMLPAPSFSVWPDGGGGYIIVIGLPMRFSFGTVGAKAMATAKPIR